MKPKSKVLIIAGSDSSGGAGIQADIKTVSALGSYAMTAVTAVTAQNTTGVRSIVPIPPKEIFNQIVFTANDINGFSKFCCTANNGVGMDARECLNFTETGTLCVLCVCARMRVCVSLRLTA